MTVDCSSWAQDQRERVEAELARMFAHRHATLAGDLRLHARCSTRPLNLLISGASGVLGAALNPC